jgi:2-keto-4-pentenoate hydratase/2-oxohepta-3-ene-1,7-dioic acid hydratase in catechol pathway
MKEGMPWALSKGYDTFAPLGPCIVPAQSLDPQSLPIWLKVNGQIRQSGNTRDMVFGVARLISYLSSVMTLEPHDIIATGTPEGVGPLLDGDLVEAGIDGIGVLRFQTRNENREAR